MKNFFTLLIISSLACYSFGQQLSQRVVLIGNTANLEAGNTLLKEILKEASVPNTTITLLGDITDENGISKDPKGNNKDLLAYYKQLENNADGGILIISGDRDWDDNGKKGEEKNGNLEKYLRKNLEMKDVYVSKDACLDPVVSELNDVVIVAFNSQWFMHPYRKHNNLNTSCGIVNEKDFFEELEDIVDDNDGKNIILAAHHPVYSSGRYFGKGLHKLHMLPIVGPMIIAHKNNIGNAKEYSNDRYHHFITRMRSFLSDKSSIIYASSHEHSNFIWKEDFNYYLNSSASNKIMKGSRKSNNVYHEDAAGYQILNYYDDGSVSVELVSSIDGGFEREMIELYSSPCNSSDNANRAFNPCEEDEDIRYNYSDFSNRKHNDTLVVAGEEYGAGSFRRFFMGSQFRDEWTTPIHVPYLDLKEVGGGLKPYAKGGGLQTISLKFKGEDGQKYAFRQVNKKPEKSLTEDLKTTIYKDIVKDLIASQHPYGGLVASKLMKKLDILHAVPRLYVMPDDEILGPYREEFAGKLGTLEKKPKAKKGKGFGNADKIVKSNQMFRSMFKNSQNRIDNRKYALARTFDMWLGDWDRHEDNWIWARYDSKDGKTFVPIPKDRDHVFSHWTGLVPGIADKVIMNAEHFDYKFGNLKQLNFKARWLDRQLANEVTKEDWIWAAEKIKNEISDEDIEEAINEWPDEIVALKGEEIRTKLISRREELAQAVSEHYASLAEEVDIVGSKKDEIFEIKGNEDGSIQVRMKKDSDQGRILYERIFNPNETKKINLYGLPGKDEFTFIGVPSKKIKVRIIGGDDTDKLMLNDWKKVDIYDNSEEDKISSTVGKKVKKTSNHIDYNNEAFNYGSLLPLPVFRQSSGNRFGFGFSLVKTTLGFNKPQFSSKYKIFGVYYPRLRANKFSVDYWYRYVWGTSNLRLSQLISSRYDQFPYFYGIGSGTSRSQEFEENEIYRLDFFTMRSKVGLEKSFWKKSHINGYINYEMNDVKDFDPDNTILNQYRDLEGLGENHYIGLEVDFELDFTDNSIFPKNGTKFKFHNYTLVQANNENNVSNISKISLSQNTSVNFISEIVLTGRVGGMFATSNTPFFHKPHLGSNGYLRGYTRNRFVDDNALYYNLESKIHLGTLNTILAPLRFGVFGFYDKGIVWGEESFGDNNWRDTYGMGMYLTPISDSYALNFYLAKSEDRGIYFRYTLGWVL